MPPVDLESPYGARRQDESAQTGIADTSRIANANGRHECFERGVVVEPELGGADSTPDQCLDVDVRVFARRTVEDDQPRVWVCLAPKLDPEPVRLRTGVVGESA